MSGWHGKGLGLVVLCGALLGAAAWKGTDVLEQDNDFCNACHLSDNVPLHIDIREDFDLRPAPSLAAAHGAVSLEGRPDAPAFRCIDCHGGVGLVGRVRVKVLAAKDAFWWVVGSYDEPTEMKWPLLEEDCRQCHSRFETKAEAWAEPDFHDLSVHNAELGVDCVECHLSHRSGANADAWYLHAAHVRTQCARCHSEYEGGS